MKLLLNIMNYTDSRGAVAGDMQVAGVNCWAKPGYSIGCPMLNHCLNIASDGNVTMPYIVKIMRLWQI